MQNLDVHEIIIGKENLEILSADAEFYSFIGKRLYTTFEGFVLKEDKELFYQKLKECSGERFLLRLVSEMGQEKNFFTEIKEGPAEESIMLQLLYAEELVEAGNELKRALRVRNALLEMYNDTYFEYTPEHGMVKIYSLCVGEQNVVVLPLEEFEQRLILYAKKEQTEDIHEFVANVKLGLRRFGMQAEGNLLDGKEKDTMTTINAISLYERGKLSIVAGYIHLGAELCQGVQRKIEVDSLTGLVAKADITHIAIDTINIRKVKGITIAIVDIDYFKKVNDIYGHMCGDEVIKEVAEIMQKEVGSNGLVGRIGGDEFLIIFYEADDMENMRGRLKCIKNTVNASFPPDRKGRPAITVSIGCAAYPKDADNYEDIFQLADFALYLAKEKGRNRYIIFDEKKHGELLKKRNAKIMEARIDGRGDMPLGDILCVMMDKVYGGEEYPFEKLLDDFVINFTIQRVMVFAGEPYHMIYVTGEQRPSGKIISDTEDYVNDPEFQKRFGKKDFLILDEVKVLEDKLERVYQMLCKLNVVSMIQIKTLDQKGNPVILSLESVKRRTTWNRSNLHYYRLFAKMFSEYELL